MRLLRWLIVTGCPLIAMNVVAAYDLQLVYWDTLDPKDSELWWEDFKDEVAHYHVNASISDDGQVVFYRPLLAADNSTLNHALFRWNGESWQQFAGKTGADEILISDDISKYATISDNGDYIGFQARGNLLRLNRDNVGTAIMSAGDRPDGPAGATPLHLNSLESLTGGKVTISQLYWRNGVSSVSNDGTLSTTGGFNTTGSNVPVVRVAILHGDGGKPVLWGSLEKFSLPSGTPTGAIGINSYNSNDFGFRVASVYDTQTFPANSGGMDVWVGSDLNVGIAQTTSIAGFTDFRVMNILDTIPDTYVFLGEKQGVEGIYQGIFPQSATTLVDSTGPFEWFWGLSANDAGQIAFLASLDFGLKPYGVYSGPDPIRDKVVAVGDVIAGHSVQGVDIVDQDAINNSGQIALTVYTPTAHRTMRVFIANPRPASDQAQADVKAQMSTLEGTMASLESETIAIPGDTFAIGFAMDWMAGSGALSLYLGNTLVSRFGPEDGGEIVLEHLDPTTFGVGLPLPLRFELEGTTGTTISLNDVKLLLADGTELGPTNGDFEVGYLDTWTAGPQGLVFANAYGALQEARPQLVRAKKGRE